MDAVFNEARKLLAELKAKAALIQKVMDDARDGDHIHLIRVFHAVSQNYDVMDSVKKSYNKTFDDGSKEYVPDALRRAGVKSIRVEDVGNVVISHRFSCSIREGMQDDAFSWLKSNGHGGLIKETVNSNTLSAFAKNLIEDEGKELPDNIFKTSSSPYTSIRK